MGAISDKVKGKAKQVEGRLTGDREIGRASCRERV